MTGNKDKYDELIVRFLSGDTNKHETKELVEWIEDNAENRSYFDENLHIWQTAGAAKANTIDVDSAIDKFTNKYDFADNESTKIISKETETKFLTLRRIAVAASLLIIVGLGIYVGNNLLHYSKIQLLTENEKSIQKDLPDGSVISLNKNTTLQYEENYFTKRRTAYLTGEAFFEIKSVESSLFYVVTERATIEVTGTSFNVRAYPQEGNVEVVVDEGNVILYPNIEMKKSVDIDTSLTYKIHAGEKLIFNDQEAIKKENKTDQNRNSYAWKSNILSFYETSLKDVFAILENTYNVKIVVKSPEVYRCELTADFYQQSIDAIMEILGSLFIINIQKDQNTYIIQGAGC